MGFLLKISRWDIFDCYLDYSSFSTYSEYSFSSLSTFFYSYRALSWFFFSIWKYSLRTSEVGSFPFLLPFEPLILPTLFLLGYSFYRASCFLILFNIPLIYFKLYAGYSYGCFDLLILFESGICGAYLTTAWRGSN